MCGNQKWDPLEVIAPTVYVPPPRATPGQTAHGMMTAQYEYKHALNTAQAMPLLVLGCTKCFHTVLYAWKPIESGVRSG